jgi:replicative DNA helicase
VTDVRATLPTGFDGVDALLRRGGLLPGNFVLLAGRTGTRKTTIALNMMVHLAGLGVPCGFVGLDEAPWTYTLKGLSVLTGRSQDDIERTWSEAEGHEVQARWRAFAKGRVHLFAGRRPGPEHLDAAMAMADMAGEASRPAVLFVDYLSLLSRAGDFGYGENTRVPRLAEEMQVWSTERGVTVVMLHQLGRNDEHGGTNNRNAGHIPVSLAQLKYGGEEQADIVLGTYRPSMHPIANMSFDVAKEVLGQAFDEDEYYELRGMAKRYERSTFLQLLKNRPGTHREERGVELLSPDESLRMTEKEAEEPSAEREASRSARP